MPSQQRGAGEAVARSDRKLSSGGEKVAVVVVVVFPL